MWNRPVPREQNGVSVLRIGNVHKSLIQPTPHVQVRSTLALRSTQSIHMPPCKATSVSHSATALANPCTICCQVSQNVKMLVVASPSRWRRLPITGRKRLIATPSETTQTWGGCLVLAPSAVGCQTTSTPHQYSIQISCESISLEDPLKRTSQMGLYDRVMRGVIPHLSTIYIEAPHTVP